MFFWTTGSYLVFCQSNTIKVWWKILLIDWLILISGVFSQKDGPTKPGQKINVPNTHMQHVHLPEPGSKSALTLRTCRRAKLRLWTSRCVVPSLTERHMSVRLNVGELPGKPQGSRSATSGSLFRLEVTQSRTEWTCCDSTDILSKFVSNQQNKQPRA